MLDIRSDLKARRDQRISLYELVESLKKQSPDASYSDIAEWLLVKIDEAETKPSFGFFTIGGGISDDFNSWEAMHGTLRQMLIDLYRNGNYPLDPDEVPF